MRQVRKPECGTGFHIFQPESVSELVGDQHGIPFLKLLQKSIPGRDNAFMPG